MQSSWLVVALILSVASFSEGKSANLVLLSDAPGQSVSKWLKTLRVHLTNSIITTCTRGISICLPLYTDSSATVSEYWKHLAWYVESDVSNLAG